MAYNVIKGNVEFSGLTQGTIEDMVDDHTDQTIGGTKTFSQMVTASNGLSASFFYGDGSNISNVVADGLNVTNPGNNRIITSTTTTELNAETNLRFNGSTLSIIGDISASLNVSSSGFYGDGNNLTNIGPSSLNYGNGLRDLANNLELNLDTASGLQVGVGGLKVHASTLDALTNVDIHGDDLFLMYDDSASQNKKFSFSSLTTYLDNTTTFSAAGANTQIQFNDGGDFGASSNLTFASNTLSVTGSTILNGTASTANIMPLADEQYDIGDTDTRYENAFFNFMDGAVAFTGVNDEGANLVKGNVVYLKGVSGNTPTVALAACDDPAKMPAFGFVADGSVPNGQPVRIATFGRLNGVDTSTFSLGDTLYVQTGSGGISGSYTNVAPTGSGNLLQNIGKVAKVDASGLIRVGGAGRTNATPNLDKGYLFIGNDSDQSVQDNTIFVSSSQNRVGINTTTPAQALDVNGNLKTQGSVFVSTSVHTASYSIIIGDEIVIMNNSSVATASLPTIGASDIGLKLTIKRTGTGEVHVSGSDTIDSVATKDLTPQGAFMEIVAADFGGSNYGWAIIAKSGSF